MTQFLRWKTLTRVLLIGNILALSFGNTLLRGQNERLQRRLSEVDRQLGVTQGQLAYRNNLIDESAYSANAYANTGPYYTQMRRLDRLYIRKLEQEIRNLRADGTLRLAEGH